jgi:hypothetical protein
MYAEAEAEAEKLIGLFISEAAAKQPHGRSTQL